MTSTQDQPYADVDAPAVDDVTATVEADDGRVSIVGYVVRWNQAGQTSAGRLVFDDAGRVALPADLSRVKLLIEHRARGAVIGHGAEARPDDVGLWMRFAIPLPDRSPALDAIEDVRHQLRDSFSPGVELDDATRLRLRRAQLAPVKGDGRLREVSLVAIPGFDDWGPREEAVDE